MTPSAPNYITIPIDDPALSVSVITQLIRMVETTEGLDWLLEAGCDPQLVDTVRHLKTRDLFEIAPKIKGLLSVSLADLVMHVKRLLTIRNDQELFEYFIRHGANNQFVAGLWKKSVTEVKEQRRLLIKGKDDSSAVDMRATPKLRANLHQRIQETWYQIRANNAMALREQIHKLHQSFPDMTIDAVYRVASEFDDDAQDAPQNCKYQEARRV
ncbi:MAG: DUF2857 domain-containing protein [Burkholderiaceae bacterium]|jgi:hypothetical protein|nr:DUF2857 domain-containing protein [Burkholderiaceae bacterium]